MNPETRLVVILNRESGTMRSLGEDQVKKDLIDAFQKHGINVELQTTSGKNLASEITSARDGNADLVVIGGGDGTVASAATIIAGTDKPLGVLPLGTFNLAARDLGMPLDLGAAAEALIDAPISEMDVLEVNGKRFLCVVVLGFYPAMALRGEEYHGNWMVKAWKTGWQVIRSMAWFPPLELVLEENGKEVRTRTRFMALVNNGYEDLPGLIPKRERLDGGYMTVYVSNHRTRWGYLKSLLAWMLGRWKQDREMLTFRAGSLRISGKRKRGLAVMCDGEIEKIKLPFEIKVLPRALKVLAPIANETSGLAEMATVVEKSAK